MRDERQRAPAATDRALFHPLRAGVTEPGCLGPAGDNPFCNPIYDVKPLFGPGGMSDSKGKAVVPGREAQVSVGPEPDMRPTWIGEGHERAKPKQANQAVTVWRPPPLIRL
jgi:hypothetical protein